MICRHENWRRLPDFGGDMADKGAFLEDPRIPSVGSYVGIMGVYGCRSSLKLVSGDLGTD